MRLGALLRSADPRNGPSWPRGLVSRSRSGRRQVRVLPRDRRADSARAEMKAHALSDDHRHDHEHDRVRVEGRRRKRGEMGFSGDSFEMPDPAYLQHCLVS